LQVTSHTAQVTSYYVHHDALGNTIAITDKDQNLIETYQYDPYGNPHFFDANGEPITESQIGNQRLYTGRIYEPETKLYDYRWRTQSPKLGRFLQRDPIGYKAGLNLFSYVWNSPLNWLDPFGLLPGQSYNSPDEAALQAIDDVNNQSIQEGVEYAGRLYELNDGLYSYTSPNRGTKDRSTPGFCENSRGYYHTHGDNDPRYDNENFSPADKYIAELENYPGYVGTPSGSIKKYVPGNDNQEGRVIILKN